MSIKDTLYFVLIFLISADRQTDRRGKNKTNAWTCYLLYSEVPPRRWRLISLMPCIVGNAYCKHDVRKGWEMNAFLLTFCCIFYYVTKAYPFKILSACRDELFLLELVGLPQFFLNNNCIVLSILTCKLLIAIPCEYKDQQGS